MSPRQSVDRFGSSPALARFDATPLTAAIASRNRRKPVAGLIASLQDNLHLPEARCVMLIGYVLVSKPNGTQTLAPWRDPMLASCVDPTRIHEDLAPDRHEARP